MRRKGGVDVCVHCAVNVVPTLSEQRVAADPVVCADDYRGHGCEDPQVASHLLPSVRARSELQSAVEVGHGDRDRQREKDKAHQERNDQLKERKSKDEERNVPPENWVGLPEGRRIEPGEDSLPSFGEPDSNGDTDQ